MAIKRRFYIRCMKVYVELFQGKKEKLINKQGGIQEPYLWNDLLEDDQFGRNLAGEEGGVDIGGGSSAHIEQLTEEGIKMQLKQMYAELIKQMAEVRPKVSQH